jgi:hypothetical protein
MFNLCQIFFYGVLMNLLKLFGKSLVAALARGALAIGVMKVGICFNKCAVAKK